MSCGICYVFFSIFGELGVDFLDLSEILSIPNGETFWPMYDFSFNKVPLDSVDTSESFFLINLDCLVTLFYEFGFKPPL